MARSKKPALFTFLDDQIAHNALAELEHIPVVRKMLIELSAAMVAIEHYIGDHDLVRQFAAARQLEGTAQYIRYAALAQQAQRRIDVYNSQRDATIVIDLPESLTTPSDRRRARRLRLKAEGICVSCGKRPAVTEQTLCSKCKRSRVVAKAVARQPRADRPRRDAGKSRVPTTSGRS